MIFQLGRFEVKWMISLRTGMFLALLLLASVSYAALAVTDWQLSQADYTSGSNGVISLTISNPTSAANPAKLVNNVQVDVISPPEITLGGSQYVGDIEPGGSTKISMPFTIKDSAKSAIYTVTFKVTGIANKETGGYDTFARTTSVPVIVTNQPILHLQTSKEVIGGIDSVVLTITNDGGKASKLKVSIPANASMGSSPVALFGIDQIFVPSVQNGASVMVNVTMDSRDAPDGATNVPFYIQYEDELGMPHQQLTSLRLTVRNEKLDLKILQQSDVITRKESNLTFQIRNDGLESLRDVRLSFQNSSAVRLKDQSEMKFGDIPPGGTAVSSVTVVADLPPGVNLLESSMRWIEKDIQRQESRSVPVTITSDADVGVFLEAKPSPLTAGSEHTISVLVSNLGSYPIDNVAVRFSSDTLSMLDISSEQYIGNLNNDDFSTVQFKVRVKAVGDGQYPVRLNVSYRDRSGEWKTKMVQRDVSVFAPIASEFNPIILVPVALVGLVVVWWVFLRKKKSVNGS
jgi:hypothetical protein